MTIVSVRGILLELVEERVRVSDRELVLVRPPDAEALLDEEAFEREEFLPYWAELWPSAHALGDAVARRSLAGRHVLELGCGLALPSIVAALRGARVRATDWAADALRVAAVNAERNGVRIETAVCSWADPAPLVAAAPWDLVLASDVLYEARNGELLLGVLPQLVDARGEVLLADPGRPAAPGFLARAEECFQISSSGRGSGAATVYALRKRR